jgi:RHS repeat-associated protein
MAAEDERVGAKPHLGSTSAALDKQTGELVERATYQAYGARESDYRPGRWGEFREDYGFTGKEEDVEVGLVYFGKRFYAPALQRWVSADPLEVHAPGQADADLYAYVRARALRRLTRWV